MKVSVQLTSKQPPLAAAVFRPAHAHRRVAMVAIPRCQASNVSETLSKAAGAVLLGAILSLSAPNEAVAAVKLSTYEKERAYEQELLSALKSRTGKDSVLPDLKASPAGEVKIAPEPKKFKLSGSAEKTKLQDSDPESPVTTPQAPAPAPAPVSVSGEQTKPVSPSVASFKEPVSKPVAASPSDGSTVAPADNKTILAVAGLAVVAAAGLALTNSNGESQGEQTSSGGLVGVTATAGGPAGGPLAGDVPPNVAEARAWIAAWKKKHGKQ